MRYRELLSPVYKDRKVELFINRRGAETQRKDNFSCGHIPVVGWALPTWQTWSK